MCPAYTKTAITAGMDQDRHNRILSQIPLGLSLIHIFKSVQNQMGEADLRNAPDLAFFRKDRRG